MIRELRTSNTGLIIRPAKNEFMRVFRKKVNKQAHNLSMRNTRMLELAWNAGDLPISSYKGDPVDLINTTFKPPQWRETNIKIEASYYQKAIIELGAKHTFSINLSAELLRTASEKGYLDYIRRTLSRVLNENLGRKVDFWLILETNTRDSINQKLYDHCLKRHSKSKCDKEFGPSTVEGRPHIHGVIVIDDSEKVLIKKAVRALNGEESDNFRRKELFWGSIPNSMGWVKYLTKQTGLTRTFLPNSNLITCNNKVSRLAREIYEADRQFVKNLIKKSKLAAGI